MVVCPICNEKDLPDGRSQLEGDCDAVAIACAIVKISFGEFGNKDSQHWIKEIFLTELNSF